MRKDKKRQFTKETSKWPNPMSRHPISSVFREIQIKTMMWYHYTPIRTKWIKWKFRTKFKSWGCGNQNSHIWLLEVYIILTTLKDLWQYPLRLNIPASDDLAILHLLRSIKPTETCVCICICTPKDVNNIHSNFS